MVCFGFCKRCNKVDFEPDIGSDGKSLGVSTGNSKWLGLHLGLSLTGFHGVSLRFIIDVIRHVPIIRNLNSNIYFIYVS